MKSADRLWRRNLERLTRRLEGRPLIDIRLGLPLRNGRMPRLAAEIGAPMLMSANAFRSRRNLDGYFGGFVEPNEAINGLDVALDSAGFVAMAKYRGFDWTVEQYVGLAAAHPWAWWASMDCCVEPEVAADRRARLLRIAETARLFRRCRDAGRATGIADPMPVLQGWNPTEYGLCADLMPFCTPEDWPDMVGVGSMCRRDVEGPHGVLAVLDTLDRVLPAHVGLHLFGVKGEALEPLAAHPRVVSIDSMAWDFHCRLDHDGSRTVDVRVGYMRRWYDAQAARVAAWPLVQAAPNHDDEPPFELDDEEAEWLQLVAADELDATSAASYWARETA